MNAQPLDDLLHSVITPFPPPEADPFAALIQPEPAPAENPRPASGGLSLPTSFLHYWQFTENPFADCVHPTFFYRTEAHAEAFRTMMLAIEFNSSLSMVTAPSGMGKTMVSQLVLQHLDPAKYVAALVLVTPGLSKTGLLREILSELSIPLPLGVNRVQDLVKLLSNYIIDLQAEDKRLVLLIDESHLLSADCLHIIRTISNIEAPEKKLVTCALFGESRLAQRLDHPSYESLRNRIYLRYAMEPLNTVDAEQYIKYRMMIAGRLTEVFTPQAFAIIHERTGGICRSINKLCMLSLIEGAARNLQQIDEGTVEACAKRM